MSDSEDFTVIYMEVSSPLEDLSDIGSPGVDGLPMMLEDPYAYVEDALQAPPSPDHVPGPEHPPSPKFFLEPVYPEFMPPEDEIFLAEEQPLPAAVSHTADSPGYITDFDPEEDPEEDLEEDPTDYPADGGDNDDDDESFNDDEDDDDVEEDEDEDEEEEEHPDLVDSIPPPVHCDTARMSIREQPPTPFWSEAEIVRLLDILSPPPSPLSPWSSSLSKIPSPLPQILSPLVHVSSPPVPASPTYPLGYRATMIQLADDTSSTSHLLPSTCVSEVTLPPQMRLCIALGLRYEVSESSSAPTGGAPVIDDTELARRMTDFVTTVRQDTNEIYGRLDDAHDDKSLMSDQLNMLSRDKSIDASDTARSEVTTLQTTVLAHQVEIAGLRAADHTRQAQLTKTLRLKITPKRTTRSNPAATTTFVTNAQLKAMIDQCVTDAVAVRALTWWNSHVRTIGHDVMYAMTWTYLKKKMTNKMFPEESDKIERYIGGLPNMIHGSVVALKPKTMQEAIKVPTKLMDKKIRTFAKRQTENKRKQDDNQQQQQNKRSTANANTANNQRGTGAGGNGNAPAKVYAVGRARTNPDSNIIMGTFLLNNHYASVLFDTGADRSFVSTTFSSQIDITPSTLDYYYDVELADRRIIRLNAIIQGCTLDFLNHPFNIDLIPIKLGSLNVIIGMDWLEKYQAVIICAEKIVRIPWGNEMLIVRGDKSDQGNETCLNIISCTKTQRYMLKGCPIFLAHVTTKETEDKSEKKRLEDVAIV
uniref:Reverse transcriptase domain-containing protein n=1 Tax=Tanacetum cinerariifolium TaxID=118510 RepID=A0A699H2X8_TANCI|nr:reverse transcriptase domain-containing protein [Tanacetum cinerariifolium]